MIYLTAMHSRMYRTVLLTRFHPGDFYIFSNRYILKVINSGFLEEAKRDIHFLIDHQKAVSRIEPKTLIIGIYLSLITNDEKMCNSFFNQIETNDYFYKEDLIELYELIRFNRFKFN